MANGDRTPGMVLRDIECYSANLAEFAKELNTKLIDPTTDQFRKVDVEFAVTTINTAFSKLQETLNECEGSQLNITLPEGPAGTLIKLVLDVLGIKI